MFARLNDELFCVEYDAFPFFNDDLVFQRNRCILSWVEVPELCSPRVKRWLGADVSKSHAPTPG